MAPETTGVASNVVRVRLAAGILALNRFMMTLQSKRMPLAHLKVNSDAEGTSIELGLDCPEETARRYAVLLENMEDVRELHFSATAPEGRSENSIDYDGRRFRSVENSDTGEVGPETVFGYRQDGDVVSATYEGGDVRFGTLVATADGEAAGPSAVPVWTISRSVLRRHRR